MTRIANQHQQQGLKRFLFCLIFWFLVTQCDYEWVFNSVQNYLQPETELEVNEQGSDSDSKPFKSTGKNFSYQIEIKKTEFHYMVNRSRDRQQHSM